jgi:hypothetical protein
LGSEQIIGHAAATAAAAAAAAGDAGSQARHLTVLVHRLQSKPGEDVLAELAACAGTICRQAWVDNFSKVGVQSLSAAQGHTSLATCIAAGCWLQLPLALSNQRPPVELQPETS